MAGDVVLFEAIFNFVHFHIHRELANFDSLKLVRKDSIGQNSFVFTANFSLDVLGSALNLCLDYNGAVIEKKRAETIAGYYARALEAMVNGPDKQYESSSLLSNEEQRQLLEEWNDTERELSGLKCIQELFEEQVERTPETYCGCV